MKRNTILSTVLVAILSIAVVIGTRALLWASHRDLNARNEAQKNSIEQVESLAMAAVEIRHILEALASGVEKPDTGRLAELLNETGKMVGNYTDSAGTDELRQLGRSLGWAHFDLHGIANHIVQLTDAGRKDDAARLSSSLALVSLSNYQQVLEELRTRQYDWTAGVWSSFAEHFERNGSLILIAVWLVCLSMAAAVFLATRALRGMARSHDEFIDEILAEHENLSPWKLMQDQFRTGMDLRGIPEDANDVIDADILPDEELLQDTGMETARETVEWGPRLIPFEERKSDAPLKAGRKAYDSRGLVLIKA